MSDQPLLELEATYLDDLKGLYEPWQGAPAPDPRLVVLNDDLAAELGLDAAALRTPEAAAVLAGATTPEGATPVALAYAGHQFGGYSPRLGDGRALLLGELVAPDGRRLDLHLKGSGRTPFARGGDGKAVLGPMLREHVISEAMHALGIPTTRSLAVVATGEPVMREEGPLPGAVLARVASSHLRVGTFQYAAAGGDLDVLRRLADTAIDRHHPQVRDLADPPYLALLQAVVEAQAALVAGWMTVGFVHGVMNTDNVTISGETIDYGPCAFLDVFDPSTVFSSIDHGGRYAYGNQPQITMWNLARLAEALLPLVPGEDDVVIPAATEILREFPERYVGHWTTAMRTKLGLAGEDDGDAELAEAFLTLLGEQRVDFTAAFRSLSRVVRGDADGLRSRFAVPWAIDGWLDRWTQRRADDARSADVVAAAMDRANPIYIPRNHLVEEALAAATAGDPTPFHLLVEAVRKPFDERDGFERYALGAPDDFGPYQTFCGT